MRNVRKMSTSQRRSGRKRTLTQRYLESLDLDKLFESEENVQIGSQDDQHNHEEQEEFDIQHHEADDENDGEFHLSTTKRDRKGKKVMRKTSVKHDSSDHSDHGDYSDNDEIMSDNGESCSSSVTNDHHSAPLTTTFDDLFEDVVLHIFSYLNHRDVLHTMMYLSKDCYQMAQQSVLWTMFFKRMWPNVRPPNEMQGLQAFRQVYTSHCVECGCSDKVRGLIQFSANIGGVEVHMCVNCGAPGSEDLIGRTEALKDLKLNERQVACMPSVCRYVRKWRTAINMMPRKLVEIVADDIHFDIGGIEGLESMKEERRRRRLEAIERNRTERREKLETELERRGIDPKDYEYMINTFALGRSDTKSVKKQANKIAEVQARSDRNAAINKALKEKGLRMDLNDENIIQFLQHGTMDDLEEVVDRAEQRQERSKAIYQALKTRVPGRRVSDPEVTQFVLQGEMDDLEEVVERIAQRNERSEAINEALESRNTYHFDYQSEIDQFIKHGIISDLDEIVESIFTREQRKRQRKEIQRLLDNYRLHSIFNRLYVDQQVKDGREGEMLEIIRQRIQEMQDRREAVDQAMNEDPELQHFRNCDQVRDFIACKSDSIPNIPALNARLQSILNERRVRREWANNAIAMNPELQQHPYKRVIDSYVNCTLPDNTNIDQIIASLRHEREEICNALNAKQIPSPDCQWMWDYILSLNCTVQEKAEIMEHVIDHEVLGSWTRETNITDKDVIGVMHRFIKDPRRPFIKFPPFLSSHLKSEAGCLAPRSHFDRKRWDDSYVLIKRQYEVPERLDE